MKNPNWEKSKKERHLPLHIMVGRNTDKKSDNDNYTLAYYSYKQEYREKYNRIVSKAKILIPKQYFKRSFKNGRGYWEPIIENKNQLFSILHELGHIAVIEKYGQGIPVLDDEILAWDYAARCVKPEYHDELMKEAFKCLQAYENAGYKLGGTHVRKS